MGVITELFSKNAPPVAPSMALSTVPLESVIDELGAFGRLSLMRLRDGWTASVDLNSSAHGVSGRIRSEFDHQTPISAVLECLDRCNAAFKGKA